MILISKYKTNDKYINFELKSRTNGIAYMTYNRYCSNYKNPKIIILNTYKFLKLWKNDSIQVPELSRGSIKDWINDYKYHLAKKGFSEGVLNPVPLAELELTHTINVKKESLLQKLLLKTPTIENYYSIFFQNGITRTVWLLANDFEEFPICCCSYTSDVLYEMAGVKHYPIIDPLELK